MGIGVHRREHKGECQGQDTVVAYQKGEYTQEGKRVIPKQKGGILGGSQGEHGVPRKCQGEGVRKKGE